MKRLASLITATVLLTGCTSSDSGGGDTEGTSPEPTNSASAEAEQLANALKDLREKTKAAVFIDIVIKDGKVTPLAKKVEAKVGSPIVLHVTSEVAEEIHVHSDPEHEYEVAAAGDETFTFTVDTPGQVAVEAHHLDVTIVELVVRP